MFLFRVYNKKLFMRTSKPLLAAVVIMAMASLSAAPPAGYIYREGTQLYLNGEQYKFAGINWDVAEGCWTGEAATPEAADRFFRELNPRSMTRVWVMPGNDLSVYDVIFDAAKANDQYLCITLFNGLSDCNNHTVNYSSSLPASEKDWIDAVVSRHAGDPVSAMFEIANEAHEGDNVKGWYDAVAARIKANNPLALVGTGGGNNTNTISAITTFASGPDIDLISLHDYYGSGVLSPRAGIFSDAAEQLDKPWYMGERGFCCNGGNTGSYSENASKLTQEYEAYLADQNNAGYLYWDFKQHHDETSTANFGNALWEAVSNYQNQFQGGAEGQTWIINHKNKGQLNPVIFSIRLGPGMNHLTILLTGPFQNSSLLSIYNGDGSLVNSVDVLPGTESLRWNYSGHAGSGVYFYTLLNNDFQLTGRLIAIR